PNPPPLRPRGRPPVPAAGYPGGHSGPALYPISLQPRSRAPAPGPGGPPPGTPGPPPPGAPLPSGPLRAAALPEPVPGGAGPVGPLCGPGAPGRPGDGIAQEKVPAVLFPEDGGGFGKKQGIFRPEYPLQ